MLDGHPRAIRVYDTFPLIRDNGRVLYCLAIEYARHGDLRAYLKRTGKVQAVGVSASEHDPDSALAVMTTGLIDAATFLQPALASHRAGGGPCLAGNSGSVAS